MYHVKEELVYLGVDIAKSYLDAAMGDKEERPFAAQKLTAINGVGARTAALLLAQMPELGQLNRREEPKTVSEKAPP